MRLVSTLPSRVPRTLARDRHEIPYLGNPEDVYRAAWDNAWSVCRTTLRSPAFEDRLKSALSRSPASALALTEEETSAALAAIQRSVEVPLARIVNANALAAIDEYRSPPRLLKAKARRKKAEPLPSRAHVAHARSARAQTHSLITSISNRQRAAIHAKITRSIERGVTVDRTGKQIANIVGLFPRWQKAVNTLHRSMLDNGIPIRVADKRAAAYSDELITKRGMMIARTELMRSMNEGRLLGWQELDRTNQIDGGDSYKFVQIGPGACPDCEYIADPNGDGQPLLVRGIDGVFDTPWGPQASPPFHPHCRCTMVLRPMFVEGRVSGQGFGRPIDMSDLSDEQVAALMDEG